MELWRLLCDTFHEHVYVERPSQRFDFVAANLGHLMGEVDDAIINVRRYEPKDDVITHLINVEIDGKRCGAGHTPFGHRIFWRSAP